jgi:hypothetical protein
MNQISMYFTAVAKLPGFELYFVNIIPLIIKRVLKLGLKLMPSLLFAKGVTVTASVLNQD